MIMEKKDPLVDCQAQGELYDPTGEYTKRILLPENERMSAHRDDDPLLAGAVGGQGPIAEDEHTEPNRPTESSDTDSACETGEYLLHYENCPETNTVRCFQETCPPSSEEIAKLTYRRDTLEQELTNCNTQLRDLQHCPPSPQVTIRYSLEGVEKEALQAIESKIDDFKANMASYGIVVDSHPGCVVIRLKIQTMDQLEKLKVDYKSGVLRKVLCEWLKSATNNSGEIENFEVEVSTDRIAELHELFEAEELTSPVHLTYCKLHKSWYWSADLKWWHSLYMYQVQGGTLTGKVAQKEDILFMDKLKLPNLISPHDSSKPCILCELKSRHPKDPNPKPAWKYDELNVIMRWADEQKNIDKSTAAPETLHQIDCYANDMTANFITDNTEHSDYREETQDEGIHSTDNSHKDFGFYDIS